MITEERVLDFIRSFGVDRGSEALHMIEKEAIRDDVPIIRKESGELLRILLQIKKPEKILEVGAAIGFSSVFMGENTDNNTHITTIENYPPRIERAKANIALAGMGLLAPGGILVSDNVLQDGDIFESRYGIKRRNHTIHNRMREYLYALTHDEALDTVILETGDGMAISVKKE